MTEEQWLPVTGWEGLYEVSDLGRVRSLDRFEIHRNGQSYHRRGRVLKPWPTPPMGYLMVGLNGDSQVQRVRIHTLVLEAFIGPRPDGLVACHGTAGHKVNTPANLRWDTQPENCRDTVRHGRDYQANKTHCIRRHEFTPENTRIKRDGGRQCRECIREANGAVKRRGPYKSRSRSSPNRQTSH